MLTTPYAWTPIDYVLSLANLSGSKAGAFTPSLSATLLIWTLPFLWIGVLLSVRRAKDAGLPAWIVVAFFIPLLNYLLMIALASWPTAPPVEAKPPEEPPVPARRPHAYGFIAAVAAGALTGLASMALGVVLIHSYGVAIFLMTPFLLGAVSAFVACRLNPDRRMPIRVVLSALAVATVVCVLIAFEGVVCLFMSLPLALPIAILGGIVGHNSAIEHEAHGTIALLLLLVPAGHG